METKTLFQPTAHHTLTTEAISSKTKSGLGIVFTICFISTLFGGMISMLMSVYLTSAVRDLLGNVNDTRYNEVSAWINSLFIFGWMFGGIVWGFICDKIGRSRAVILSTGFYGLFTVITAISSSWLLVSIARFMCGFGIGGVLVTTTILVSELWPDKKRAVALGILSVAIPVGFFIAGGINMFLASWRQAFWLGIIPVMLAIVAVFILPESTKWEESKKLNPTKTKDPSKQLFAKDYRKDIFFGSVIFGAMLIGLWAIFAWTPTWIQSISTAQDAPQKGGLAIMILALGGLTGSFFSGWIENIIGLRKTMIMCFAACFTFTFIVFKLTTVVSAMTFVELGILAFFFGISQGAMAVYIPLLFPTAIRASATGFCFNVGRLFTATVVFFIGALVTLLNGYGNAIFIFSFIFLAGLIATWFAKDKETIIE